MTDLDPLRYPIGHADLTTTSHPAGRASAIRRISEAPSALRAAVADLNDAQLDTPYRPGGWTVRQVVHHVADSHMNAYVRFKLGLTEADPRIRTYEETEWARQPEARTAPTRLSLVLLDALHDRWVQGLPDPADEEAWARGVVYPDGTRLSLSELLASYAWHGDHHTAHIVSLRERMNWALH